MRSGTFVVACPSLVRVPVHGRHRARFLHAMTTAEIGKLAPGEVTFALVATANGRHVGQLRLEIEADALQLVADQVAVEPILTTLKKHKVADDVRFGAAIGSDVEATLAVYGAGARELVAGVFAGQELPAERRFADLAWGDGDGRATVRVSAWDAATSELGQASLALRGPVATMAEVGSTLAAAGAETVSNEGYERLRIAAGWPRDGVDLGPEDLALASERLLATVSWNKGCFLGQEVFVMARDRGESPKLLRLVALPEDGALPGPGAALASAEGKAVGVLGSSAEAPRLGLAVIKRKHAAPGTELALEDGRVARVVSLPAG